ncbi:DJ-1/PfpI family protein [Devosia crocina]|uniref:DJ-1/PfpI family protein n=1 Tax=Devosia crocina TaxID=429728 RepID=A0A1I7N8F6_9HYPH|nr:DJ-1/PfpI family protein [Devosia crocina]SFV30931.1 DJ-1/PfpI family protein [Devosia crocina]
MVDASHPLNVGIVVFPDVEELDFVGPWEVFTMAAQLDSPINTFTVAWGDKALRCAKGLRIEADHDFSDAPKADLVIVPGGRGTRTVIMDDAFIDTLRDYLAAATWQASVCTGAALLGQTGFLDGKRATTNHVAIDWVRSMARKAYFTTEERYVRHGSVVTSGGVSAGIDMSLWFVGHLFGHDTARETQRLMEYYPEPPYGTTR